jgi:tetratricopeptide (TPR) repeat protein/transcriptional regulator with XRE-family HTH domain
MLVFMEDPAQALASSYVQVGDLVQVGDPRRQRPFPLFGDGQVPTSHDPGSRLLQLRPQPSGAGLLRRYRLASGLSQEELAQRAGLSVRALANMERGRTRRPYKRSVRLLAEAMALPEPQRLDLDRASRLVTCDVPMPGQRPTADLAQPPAGQVVPRELPASVSHFTGRAAELDELSDLMTGGEGRALVICAVGGTAGVGKTALAVHWAHQVAGRFPDGQLYVNLRGYDPGQPVPAADALAGLLRSLGVPGQDIPPEETERATRYRSLLAGKQVLVVLDNAGSADQVRPLLPGTGTCTVVVTSRDALAGLVARDGAARLDLDLLPPQEAVALLRTLIGARAAAEPVAVAELAEQCCRLPLALRVAAELAASRPAMLLAGMAAELADLRTRLDLLAAGGDPRTQVRAVFSWSYRHLEAEDARTFRLLGLHPGHDLDPYAAAALTGTTVPQARRALDVLARAHLIQPAAPGRYAMHDLLRGYALELSATVDDDQEQHAALTRLFDHYLHTAAAAMDTLLPAERHLRPRIPRPATPVPPLAGPAAAREWLDRERATLVAAARHTAAHGWPGHAIRLADTLSRHLRIGGHISEALTIFGHALDAARRTGDRVAEAAALNDIGDVDDQQGRLQQSVDRYRQALALSRAAGDRAGEARALINIGLAETELGPYEQAARHQQEAVAICRDLGDRFGEARALGSLGLAWQRQGRYQRAAGYYQQSLDMFRAIGDREGEGYALGRLGVVDLRLGRYQHAAGYLHQALAMLHEMGDTSGEAETLIKLGEVYLGLGRGEQAAGNFEQALAMFRAIGSRALEAGALNSLSDVLFRMSDADKARAHHAAALRIATEAGSPREQARAHSGLARACQANGDSLQARHHWQEALTRYAAIGAPEAREIRARLATAGDGSDDGDKPTEEGRDTYGLPG